MAPGGKPYLLGGGAGGGEGGLAFSVAHTTGLGVVAVARRKEGVGLGVGVDVELAGRAVSDGALRRILTPAEWAALPPAPTAADSLGGGPVTGAAAAAARAAAALAAWTRKEAVVKATGRGIGGGMRGFRVATIPAAPTPPTTGDLVGGGGRGGGGEGAPPPLCSLLLSMDAPGGLEGWTLLPLSLAHVGAVGAVAVRGWGGITALTTHTWPPEGEGDGGGWWPDATAHPVGGGGLPR